MRKLLPLLFSEAGLLLIRMSLFSLDTRRSVSAQTSYPDPANEHACPSQTGAGGGAEAIPAFVGSGTDGFSPNQSLCLPQLAPVPTGSSPLASIAKGVEPGDRVDSPGHRIAASLGGMATVIIRHRFSVRNGSENSADTGSSTPGRRRLTVPEKTTYRFGVQCSKCGASVKAQPTDSERNTRGNRGPVNCTPTNFSPNEAASRTWITRPDVEKSASPRREA